MKLRTKDDTANYVDFLVVGTAKAGTSSIYKYLKDHPQVYLTEQKELLFWHSLTNPNKTQAEYMNFHVNSIKEYLDLFNEVNEYQICGDVTPSYLYYYEHVINNLKKYHPKWKDVKIIIILREPVDKVISHYNFLNTGIGANEVSLEDTLKKEKSRLQKNDVLPDYFLIDTTLYYKQVEAYLENFNNVQILLYDDLKENTQKFMNSIHKFLQIAPNYDSNVYSQKYNVSKKRKVPKNKLLKNILTINNQVGASRNLKRLLGIQKKLINHEVLIKQEEISIKTRKKLKKIFLNDIFKLQELLDFDVIERWGYKK